MIELPSPSISCLRSRTSFIFLNVKSKLFIIWHGCLSSEAHRDLVRKCALKLSEKNSKNFPFGVDDDDEDDLVINEVEEGDEHETAMLEEIFEQRERMDQLYHRQLDRVTLDEFKSYTPRLFAISSLYGQFELNEIVNPIRTSQLYCPYPFHQFQLYEEKQPALFMLDTYAEIYVWQGWFENMSDVKPHQQQSVILQNELDATNGSLKIRYTMNRKCAFQTAINYWSQKYPHRPFTGYVVYAGLEPIEFTNLFPTWSVNEIARSCNLNDGKCLNQKDDINEILKQLNRDCYPLKVLRQRPLPDGVNPLKLECYLSDDEFEELLKMSKDSFFSLPAWKQTNLKKKANLF